MEGLQYYTQACLCNGPHNYLAVTKQEKMDVSCICSNDSVFVVDFISSQARIMWLPYCPSLGLCASHVYVHEHGTRFFWERFQWMGNYFNCTVHTPGNRWFAGAFPKNLVPRHHPLYYSLKSCAGLFLQSAVIISYNHRSQSGIGSTVR